MPKRLADEAVANEAVEPAGATDPQIAQSDGKDTAIIHGTQQNLYCRKAYKKLHLLSPTKEATKTADIQANDCTEYSNKNHSSKASLHDNEPTHRLKDDQAMKIQNHDPEASRGSLDTKDQDEKQHQRQQHVSTEPQMRDAKRSLVKTLSDMPVFVTIEGYRVLSYSIDGEPHLCLPQLLQFIQQKFQLDKFIDECEESMTNFVEASPKQIEGLVKAMVLPQNATTCPLIKRSDAERICLALFDQQTKEKYGNMVDFCSKGDISCEGESVVGEKQSSEPIEQASKEDTRKTKGIMSGVKEGGAVRTKASSIDDSASEDSFRTSSGRNSQEILSDVDEQSTKVLKTDPEAIQNNPKESPLGENIAKTTDNQKPDISEHGDPSPNENQIQCSARTPDSESKQNLFDEEAQATILNLARSVTSTLRIQVYHRCFGKCVGLYYPSMLRNSESDCIECSICHKLLSPRRFIGHTHGAKELHVCHWGFDSYNWRSYIRLSRKQSMNHLDDDELLIQFNVLRSVKDEGTNLETKFQNTNSSDHVDIAASKNVERGQPQELRNQKGMVQSNPLGLYSNPKDNIAAKPSTSRGPIDELAQLSSAHAGHLQSNRTITPRLGAKDTDSYLWSTTQALAAYSLAGSMPFTSVGEASRAYTASLLGASGIPSLQSTSTGYLSSPGSTSNPLSSSMTSLTSLSHLQGGSPNLAHLIAAATSDSLVTTAERQIKQDLFVSNSLTSYLNSNGVHPSMTEQIVTNAIGFIQKARALI